MKNVKNMKKIRLCIIIDFIYGTIAGTEIQLINLIHGLDPSKYEIYLICLKDTTWLSLNAQNIKCNVKSFSYNPANHKDLINLRVAFELWKYIRSIKPDIVICFFKVSYILGVLVAHMAGVPKIVSTRRDYGLWLDNRSIYLLRFANKYVDKIITNSYLVKRLVTDQERFEPSKIQVIYNGLYLDNFSISNVDRHSFKAEQGIPNENMVVGIVAGLRLMKHHKTFLKAAKRVLSFRSDVDFVLVGDGPLRAELEDLSVRLGIGNRIHFSGWQKDVTPFLSIFDLGVNCSENEGMSNAIMEYMAFEVPCIVTKAGGNTELIENEVNGYTFELHDDRELAKLILELLENPKIRKDFADKAKTFILKECNFEKMLDAYDRLFSNLCGLLQ
jgi:L-malate glycosyltransferase